MKPGSNKGKGQRSIQSFLFKPKATASPASAQSKPEAASQSKPEQRVLGEKQPSEPALAVPPNKKPRLSRAHSQQESLKGLNSSGQHADQLSNVSQPVIVDHDMPELPAAQAISTETQQPSQHPVPARIEQRHQQFQQKLVMGAGNRTYRETQKLNAITKPKYTPLELQIVELKEKHPGVLLIVEVSSCFASCAFTVSLTMGQFKG